LVPVLIEPSMSFGASVLIQPVGRALLARYVLSYLLSSQVPI
jgi:hypothetical protein